MRKSHLYNLSLFLFLFFFTTSQVRCQSPFKCLWKTDVIIAGSGLTTTITGLITENLPRSITPDEVNGLSGKSINWFDHSSIYKFSEKFNDASYIIVGLDIALPALLFIDGKMRDDLNSISIMYLETMMFSASLPSLAKGTVKRIRPLVYNPDVPMDKKTTTDARKSFFSRHTTIAFASAVFFSTVYSNYYPNSNWKPYIWISSIVGASIVGYMRYQSGSHFPSDILTGSIVGSTIGYLIPYLHKTDENNFSLLPYTGSFSGISLLINL